MESVVVITTVYPELLAWVAAISGFVSLAATAVISPNRRWFELLVIYLLFFVANTLLVGFIVQLVTDVSLVTLEALESMPGGMS